jgi:hemolysin D
LRSPIDGVVDQLAVHTLHGVVTPAEHLMIVVPDSRNLMVEAHLANRDVGFVHTGQAVKVKVETFSFTRYGLLEGRVVGVSRDVISEDERQSSGDPMAAQGGARIGSPTYVARIALAKTSMMIDGRREQLQPGMTITAEIRTGNRTIIDYLLSPLARRSQESLHER